jgi:outer membrane protein OmpA-like peptidoglycan-associated protein
VRLLDWLGRVETGNDLFGSGESTARLRLALADPVQLSGEKFSVALSGDTVVQRKRDVVTVEGGFEAKRGGEFRLFDNLFAIRSGRLAILPGVLNRRASVLGSSAAEQADESSITIELKDPDRPTEARPLDPIVEFTAEGRVIDTLVVVQVRGPTTRPELVLVSDPPLPEYQILALLITGRVDAVDSENGAVRRKAAELVRNFHNPSLKRQLFDQMGVDSVGLGFGSSVSEPILSVGKQLSRRVFVETIYHHNAPPEENTTAGRVEYRLNPWWTLDTTVGDAGNGDLGVFWTYTFGGPPPPGAEALDKLGVRPPDDRDGDRVPDTLDQCLDVPEDTDGHEDEDGCPELDNDDDGIPDAVDRAPNAAETWNGYEDDDGAPDEAPQTREGLVITTPTIGFRPGSVRPLANDAGLQVALALLRDLPDVHYLLTGHADDRGKPEANQRISELRAERARELLVELGASEERLTTRGAGSTLPLDPEDTPEARERNRRVDMQVVEALEPTAPEPPAPEAAAPEPSAAPSSTSTL